MVAFTHIATLRGVANARHEGNIVDLALLEDGVHRWIYASGRDGALGVWNASGPGAASLVMRTDPGEAAGHRNLTRLEVMESSSGPHLLTGGVFGHDLSMQQIADTGRVDTARRTFEGDAEGHVTATLFLNGRAHVYAADRGSDEIVRYQADRNGDLSGRGDIDASGAISALATVEIGSTGFLLAADTATQTLTSYRIRSDGRTTQTDRLVAEDDLYFRHPTALETAEVGGVQYVVLAAAGSSSLSVMEIGSTGSLNPTDRVFDTRDTRFHGVTALETITRGEDVFVLAAGADDGISLLALLPGGQLHHLAQVTDSTDSGLQNVQSLTGFATDTGLTILAGSGSEGGITQMHVDLSDYGGARISAPGARDLRGGDGQDILIAGEGDVRLTGGAGADTFVFSAAHATDDGVLGRITDFTPGVDRIDLSGVLNAWSLTGVDLQDGARSALLTFGGITLEVTAAANERLGYSDFTPQSLKVMDRPTLDPENHDAVLNAPPEPEPDPEPEPPAPVPEPEPEPEPAPPASRPPPPAPERPSSKPQPEPEPERPGREPDPAPEPEPEPNPGITLNGTLRNDVLNGTAGDDFIFGMGSNDRLNGFDGDDYLDGGDKGDLLDGGNGDDRLHGQDGNDELRGAAGDDSLLGGAGTDTLIGNIGDDVMNGAALSDLVFGGPGDDFVNGGFGYDRINGGTGADKFFHLGIFDHGSDWVQDYDAAEGDVLFFGIGTASASDFQVNLAEKENAGETGVTEAFVIYLPTRQIMWALVDGGGQDDINLQIGGSPEIFDLMG